MDHAGLPLKTVLEQLDLLGEIVPVLREGFAEGRPAHVPDAPTHASLVAGRRRDRQLDRLDRRRGGVVTFTVAVVSAGPVPALLDPAAGRPAQRRGRPRACARPGRRCSSRTSSCVPLAHALADNLLTGFPPPDLAAAVRSVTEADAVVAVTPIFAASYSGLFKTFFDVVEKDALRGVPVLLAATAGSARHSLVVEHALRPLFAYLQAVVVPTGVFAATEDFGSVAASRLSERVERAAAELVALLVGAARPLARVRRSGVRIPSRTSRRSRTCCAAAPETGIRRIAAWHSTPATAAPSSSTSACRSPRPAASA